MTETPNGNGAVDARTSPEPRGAPCGRGAPCRADADNDADVNPMDLARTA